MKKLLAILLTAAALGACSGPLPNAEPEIKERSLESTLGRACQVEKVTAPNLAPPTTEDLTRRVSQEAKQGLKERSAVPAQQRAVAAHVIAAQQRYLEEAERLRSRFGADEQGYEQARADLKRQMAGRD